MKTIVIYKSKTGFTKKYAEWIAEALSADIYDISKVRISMLDDYDAIVFGGSLHAAGVTGLKMITDNFDKLKSKRIAVFATGASPAREEVINEVRDKNFTQEQQKYVKFFYSRGGFDYNKLPIIDKFLMMLLKVKIKNKKRKNIKLTSDEIGMLNAYDNPVDFTNRKNIEDIISYIVS